MNRTRFVFWAVLLMGAVLRLLYLPWMEFKEDEFRVVGLAILNVHHPLVGASVISSIGIPNPPFFIYLLSLPALFTTDPVIFAAFVAILNIIGMILFYLFLRRFADGETAAWSIALLATAPWAIVFSRKIWAQDLLVPFLILFLWMYFSYRERPTALKALGASMSLAILTQLHMSAWFFLIPLIVFSFYFRTRITLPNAILGSSAFVLLYLPYAAYVLREGFGTFQSLSPDAAGSVLLHPLRTLSLLGFGGFAFLLSQEGLSAMLSLYSLRLSIVLSAIVALIAAIAVIWPFTRKARRDDLLVLSAMVILMVNVLYLLFGIPAFPHYHIILLPFLILLFVRFMRPYRYLLAIIILSNIAFSSILLLFIKNHPERIAGDYGTPYILEEDRWKADLERISVSATRE